VSKSEAEANLLLSLAWLVSATNVIASLFGLWSSIVAYQTSGLIALVITVVYVIGAMILPGYLPRKSRFLATSFFLTVPILLYWSFKGGSGVYTIATMIFVIGGVIVWGIYLYLDGEWLGFLRR
jgi:hypothetical protein